MHKVEFTFKGMNFIVQRHPKTNTPMYRQKEHLGGAWSDATTSAANTSLHATFRKLLREAITKLS